MNLKLSTGEGCFITENYKPFTVKFIAYLKCVSTVMSTLLEYMGSLWWLISAIWSHNVQGHLEFKFSCTNSRFSFKQ